MEYSKLFLVLCLIFALSKAIPLPPTDPNTFLEETGLSNDQNAVAEGADEGAAPAVKEVVAPNYEEEKEAEAPAAEEQQQIEAAPEAEAPAAEEQQQIEAAPEAEAPAAEEQQVESAPAQEEQIIIDAEADQEPQDISTDTNGVVSDNIGNITNDVLSNVSFAIKSSLEEELGTEANDEATNGLINNVIVDILEKTSDDIKTTVGEILNNDMNKGQFEQIANEAATKVADVLGNNVLTSIASNINFNLDFEKIAKNVLSSTTENVQNFIQKSLNTSKAVVDKTMTNENSDDITISNAADIATMVTNGVSYLLKSTLCESLGDGAENVCENLANSIIVSVAGKLNDIIKSSISANTSGSGLTVACSAIPGEVFKQLTDVVANAITSQLGNSENSDPENISKISNNVLTVIINSVNNLLCTGRTDGEESGSVLIKDITGLATHIINKVNYMNEDVTSSLREEKSPAPVSGNIASGISDIQEGIKTEVAAPGFEAAEPLKPEEVVAEAEAQAQAEAEAPAAEEQQQQPEAEAEAPAAEEEQKPEAEAEAPAEEKEKLAFKSAPANEAESPVAFFESQVDQSQLFGTSQAAAEDEEEVVPEKLAFKVVPTDETVYY